MYCEVFFGLLAEVKIVKQSIRIGVSGMVPSTCQWSILAPLWIALDAHKLCDAPSWYKSEESR